MESFSKQYCQADAFSFFSRRLSAELKDACVILDEAHNVAKVCEEAASLVFTSQDLALAVNDADYSAR